MKYWAIGRNLGLYTRPQHLNVPSREVTTPHRANTLRQDLAHVPVSEPNLRSCQLTPADRGGVALEGRRDACSSEVLKKNPIKTFPSPLTNTSPLQLRLPQGYLEFFSLYCIHSLNINFAFPPKQNSTAKNTYRHSPHQAPLHILPRNKRNKSE